MKRVFDANGGVVSTYHSNPGSEDFAVSQSQDLEPYWKKNARMRGDGDGFSQDRTMQRVASIPQVVLLKWLRDDGINDRHYMRNARQYSGWLQKKLYDPDNSFVLTSPHVGQRRKPCRIQGLDAVLAEGRKP